MSAPRAGAESVLFTCEHPALSTLPGMEWEVERAGSPALLAFLRSHCPSESPGILLKI